mgnify:CR=1 FL=1
MPTIPPQLIETVVYLYPDRVSATNSETPGGTGFLVGVKFSSVNALLFHIYAVTNHHVAITGANSCIRVNKRGGGADLFEFAPDDWEFIPGLDLAAVPMPFDAQKYVTQFIPNAFFMTDEIAKGVKLNIGEDVFMIGSFVDNHGDAINTPAARFGNISLMPSILEVGDSQASIKYRGPYYCLDMRSRTGFSGSPVFYYRTAGSDLSMAGSTSMRLEPPTVALIGAHAGQFPETIGFEDKAGNKAKLTAPSGMTMVIPTEKILELLNVKKFADARRAIESDFLTKNPILKNSPVLESSKPTTTGDDVPKVMLNTPPKQHKGVSN